MLSAQQGIGGTHTNEDDVGNVVVIARRLVLGVFRHRVNGTSSSIGRLFLRGRLKSLMDIWGLFQLPWKSTPDYFLLIIRLGVSGLRFYITSDIP